MLYDVRNESRVIAFRGARVECRAVASCAARVEGKEDPAADLFGERLEFRFMAIRTPTSIQSSKPVSSVRRDPRRAEGARSEATSTTPVGDAAKDAAATAPSALGESARPDLEINKARYEVPPAQVLVFDAGASIAEGRVRLESPAPEAGSILSIKY